MKYASDRFHKGVFRRICPPSVKVLKSDKDHFVYDSDEDRDEVGRVCLQRLN